MPVPVARAPFYLYTSRLCRITLNKSSQNIDKVLCLSNTLSYVPKEETNAANI